ncbi:hypothetical protein HPA02_26090 [Bisbaumannia pacifica]|uniref:DUF4214 domain-containing protein n=1 Tax=Bisbaumannia pacifica TaxID=77098 RepID=A0A510XA58_9GAMM|nr:DUF4214 domain-containing protein [Halomonas pacifica]GEK48326.1 hypothetical protein HPA02_26090 [Halomonas pacifica]
MATQASLELAQQLFVAYYGRPADAAGQEFWAEEIDANGGDASAIINLFGTSAEFEARFGDLTNEELVNNLYQQLFGRDAEQAGLDFYVGELEAGNTTLAAIALEILTGAQNGDADAVAKKVAAAQEFTDLAGDAYAGNDAAEIAKDFLSGVDADTVVDDLDVQGVVDTLPEPTDPEEPSNPGETFVLTDGRDNLTGTDADDTFTGFVGQNQDGAVANAFATGDYINGGEGRDKIEASMIDDNEVDGAGNDQAPRPYTQNVEEIYIEALENVTLDATRMENVEEFWADFGRGDFTVNNVNLQGSNLNITKDVTFGIKDTQFDTDFTATFDSQSLLRAPEEAANSQLQIRIADVSTQTPETPLANVSVTLGFELGGQEFVLEDVVSTDGSYQGLVEAIDAALAAQGLGDLQVTLSDPYTQVTVAGNTVDLPFTAQEILVTDPNGQEFGQVDFTQAAIESVPGGFLVAGNAEPVDPTVTSNLIETNLVLDNAGRGSIAGDVRIGGESNSQIGVERFNVTVDRGSKIASLAQTSSNSDELEEIHIDSTGADGSLYVGAVDSDLNLINATAFEGAELSIGEGTAVSDLVSFNSAGSDTDVTFVADYDGNGRASDAQAFTINTGSGDDSITADLTGTSTSTSTTASLTVNSTGGDNVVTLSSTDAEVNEATVVLGSGDDTVTGGATHLTASTGGGNDTVYAENTGDKALAQLAAGSDYATTAGANTAAAVNGSQVLNGRTVQVTVAMPEEGPTVAADSFVDGFEVTAEIQAANGVLTTERDLYEAAARAINEDPVVSKLVQATVDSNGNLNVQYLVDGVTVAAEQMVQVEVLGDWADLSTANQNNIVEALQEQYQDSDIDATDVGNLYDAVNTLEDFAEATATLGTDATTVGVNTVNAGAGDDVVVLSSNDGTVDTLVFDQGGFGNDTIVHYNDAANGDVLDFTAWLDNVTSASGSTDSQQRVATSLVDQTAGLGAIGENDVVVTQLEEIDGSTVAAVEFDSLTTTQLLEALNTGGSGAAAAANFVGNIQKSIVMVENFDGTDGNLGEYKVYEVSYNIADGEFTAASLVGVTDFGDSLNVGVMDDTNVA